MSEPVASQPLISAEAREDIQGFVTSSFGHLPNSEYVFLRLGDRYSAKRWLQEVAPRITSAASWRPEPGKAKVKPGCTINLGLTATGLASLGLPESCLGTFPAEFLEGMSAPERGRVLGDFGSSDARFWSIGGPATAVDAVVLVSAETAEAAAFEADAIVGSLVAAGEARTSAREHGSLLRYGREHFGFRDGISRVEIRGITCRGVKAGEFILGYENEYGYHASGPVLRRADDPGGILPNSANPYYDGLCDFGLNGSFLVYRKLEQDVAGFWGFMQAESRRLCGTVDPRFMVWLAAKMVGRWPSGASLTVAPETDDPASTQGDDFLYAEHDPRGLGCPFGCHVRRTNPRDQLRPAGPVESLHMTSRHRLLRRGKSYGSLLFDPRLLDPPFDESARRAIVDLCPDGRERGLHFMALNASIKDQFEFIQQSWANNPHVNGVMDNRDPLIGCHGEEGDRSAMHVPRKELDLRTAPLPRFVTVRGGAYFFMPGMRAIRYLAQA